MPSVGTDAGIDAAAIDDISDAQYAAQLIRNAYARLSSSDNISQYERRVALREIKSILDDAYADMGIEPTNADVRRFLRADEHTETDTQFRCLRNEMNAVLRRGDDLTRGIRAQCIRLKALWRDIDHTPMDLFEVAVNNGGESLAATQLTLSTVTAMADAFAAALPQDGDDEFEVNIAVGEGRVRFRDMLLACNVPDPLALEMCQDVAAGGPLFAGIARLNAAMDSYSRLLEVVEGLPRDPLPGPQSDPPYELVEGFLEEVEPVVGKLLRWERVAGVPFFVSRGAQLRFGVPPDQIGRRDPFSSVLKRTVKKVGERLPCKGM